MLASNEAFLRTGVMIDVFREFGKIPVVKEQLTIFVMTGKTISIFSLINQQGKVSRLQDLFEKPLIIVSTSALVSESNTGMTLEQDTVLDVGAVCVDAFEVVLTLQAGRSQVK
jgi:hypothetical protein